MRVSHTKLLDRKVPLLARTLSQGTKQLITSFCYDHKRTRSFCCKSDAVGKAEPSNSPQIVVSQTYYQKTNTEGGVRSKTVQYTARKGKKLQHIESAESDATVSSVQDIISFSTGKLADLLLPKGFPDTVGDGYFRYASFQSIGAIFGAASGVLSTQSLLYAMGLGAGALPLAATLNWVIKDGVGMMGGIAFASFVNNRFDADPRFWRFSSALMNDFSCYMEMLSPLVPQYFLPIACATNIGKNISFLAASASRAGIHSNLALSQNLADLTGKAGSQTMVASVAGTALGVSISTVVGENWSLAFACLGALSTLHLTCQYLSLQKIVLKNLNLKRLQILVNEFQRSSMILSPEELKEKDSFTPSPGALMNNRAGIFIGTPIDEMYKTADDLLKGLEILKGEKYLLSVRGKNDINVLFKEECSQQDILKGVTHAMFAKANTRSGQGLKNCPISSSYDSILNANTDNVQKQDSPKSITEFIYGLQEKGWKTDTVFFEDSTVRFSVHQNGSSPDN